MSHAKKCLVCEKSFECPPSSKKATCSPECSRVRKQQSHRGVSNRWNKAAREKLSTKGQTKNLTLGTDAALLSPIAGPFETNHEAKLWSLKSPRGEEYAVRNLKLFIRENIGMFDGTVEQAHAGLRQVQLCMMGKTKRTVSQWKGWRLVKPAE